VLRNCISCLVIVLLLVTSCASYPNLPTPPPVEFAGVTKGITCWCMVNLNADKSIDYFRFVIINGCDEIGIDAFRNCVNVEDYVFEEGTKYLGNYCFANNQKIILAPLDMTLSEFFSDHLNWDIFRVNALGTQGRAQQLFFDENSYLLKQPHFLSDYS